MSDGRLGLFHAFIPVPFGEVVNISEEEAGKRATSEEDDERRGTSRFFGESSRIDSVPPKTTPSMIILCRGIFQFFLFRILYYAMATNSICTPPFFSMKHILLGSTISFS